MFLFVLDLGVQLDGTHLSKLTLRESSNFSYST